MMGADPSRPPLAVVLTVAGSDSSAGAGLQADLKAISACGAYGATAITAVTAQNTLGVDGVETVSPRMIEGQIDSVFADLPVAAVKTGMLGSQGASDAVARALRKHRPNHLIVDPVMVATSGDSLTEPAGVDVLRRDIFPLASLITPNVHEARILTGRTVKTPQQAIEAARALVQQGARAVLVTGGDLRHGAATDFLISGETEHVIPGEWVDTRNTHGTGCTYAAAIASYVAQGYPLVKAVRKAKCYVTEAIRAGLSLGRGHGPTDHFYFLRRGGALPALAEVGLSQVPRLTVITDESIQSRYSHAELAGLAAHGGADAVQIREKRPRTTRELIVLAERARAALRGTGTRLIVNDRMDVAYAVGADAVHLGRDDPDPQTARRLLGSSALIGGTANGLSEALAVDCSAVDYLGVGPVYGTSTKSSPAPALGVEGLRQICERVRKPVIAIGNITADRVAEVVSAGAFGIAVVSAVVSSDDPAAATRELGNSLTDALNQANQRS